MTIKGTDRRSEPIKNQSSSKYPELNTKYAWKTLEHVHRERGQQIFVRQPWINSERQDPERPLPSSTTRKARSNTKNDKTFQSSIALKPNTKLKGEANKISYVIGFVIEQSLMDYFQINYKISSLKNLAGPDKTEIVPKTENIPEVIGILGVLLFRTGSL